MRLAVGVISNRDWEPKFGVSLVNLYAYLIKEGVAGKPLESLGFFPYLNCSNICQARTTVLQRARKAEGNFTHCLFLDDDIVCPHDVVDTLGRHDVDVVGCNYQNKTIPRGTALCLEKGAPLSSKDKQGLEEVRAVGFGCCLIRLAILDKMEQPWFQHAWIPQHNNSTTDDVYFCLAANHVGFKIYVDHDASQGVKHIGKQELPCC